MTLAVTIAGPRWFWSAYGDAPIGTFWIHNGLALLTGAMLVAALIRLRRPLSLVLLGAVTCAIVTRCEPSQLALAMYGNFVHVLLALTIAAISSIAVLGLMLLFRARAAARMLRDGHAGTIECDGAAIVLDVPSWLRGPRLTSRAFTIRTAQHLLAIPPCVGIVSPVPAITTQLRTGEALELARAGDRVVVGGLVAPDQDHPFRSISAPQPDPRGIDVARAGQTAFGDLDVALSLWRPCVAYLAIGVAVALPALVAALAIT